MTSVAPQLAPNASKSLQLRRIALWTLIVAYSFSALISVLAILAGIPDIWKIVLSSTLVGNTALVGLCAVTVSQVKNWAWVGGAAISTALLAAFGSFILIWTDISNYTSYGPEGEYTIDEPKKALFEFFIHVVALGWGYAWVLLFSSLLLATTHKLTNITKTFTYITLALNALFLISGTYLYFTVFYADYTDSMSYDGLIKFVVIVSILGTLGTVITLTMATIQKVTKKQPQPTSVNPIHSADGTLNAFYGYAHQNNIIVDEELAQKLFQVAEEHKRTH